VKQDSVTTLLQVILQVLWLPCLLAWGGEPASRRSAVETNQRVAGTNRTTSRLIPFRTGACQLGKDHVLGGQYSADERMPFAIYAFLVEGPNGQKALVDLGPKTVGYLNRMFRAYGFFRDLGPEYSDEKRYPDDIVQPEGNVLEQLRRCSVAPEAIDHIVFTHLHADHHGMDDARSGGAAEDFPHATLHVSAVGWQNNLDKRKDGQWNSYVDYAFSDFLLKCQKAGKVRFHDNAEIFPGLRTFYLGGHSVCSQAVVVDTADGLAILASDEVYLYQLLEHDVLPRIRTSEAKYRAALARLVDLAVNQKAIILPLHDQIVWTTYKQAGPNWLKELRKVSDRAIAGYLKARAARSR
jgi:glyoxylase-like metal-dependent hydrolase (beta-lactamase superfamily II)